MVRFIYAYRFFLKRLIPIRKPFLVKLNGFKMYVRLDDWAVGAKIAVKRQYETHVSAVVMQYLQAGSVFVDIGANIGYYSLLAATRVGKHGQVLAFEPSADNCALLKMSMLANEFDNVVVHPYAVADINGVVGFRMDDSNGQIAQNDTTGYPIKVRAVTLDNFLANESRIDVIKMDIEGAEGLALHGMTQIIQRHHPIIFAEFSPNALPRISGMSGEAFLDSLIALKYNLFVLLRDKNSSSVAQDKDAIMTHFTGSNQPNHLDLLALPEHTFTAK